MKTHTETRFLLPVLIVGLGFILAGRVTAQTFTTLHSFTAFSKSPPYGNTDGAGPQAGLILSGNTLYGTARIGGSNQNGTVFAVNTDGSGFMNLHNFTGGTNSDGAKPFAGLILSGNTLYGTATAGGSSSAGTVFAVNTDGSAFTNLHSFDYSDGADPRAGLVLSGNTLYGTATTGGVPFDGTVFAVDTDGTGFTKLHNFNEYNGSDAAVPVAGLVLAGNTLYGTASSGGSFGDGTVFAISTDGTGFTNLHSFGSSFDGDNPYAGLVLSGNTLYGTTSYGGSSIYGTVFAVHTDGTGFTNLHSFTGGDGANPEAGLILSGNTLYGAAPGGGGGNSGTVFALNTDGTGFKVLHTFTAIPFNAPYTNSDGANPFAGLILSGNTLYGTAGNGGSAGNGTLFSLTLPVLPQLTTILAGASIILTWPTNGTGFALQSTTNLVSPVWTTNSPAPVVLNGQNRVTNPISGTRKFFRLIR